MRFVWTGRHTRAGQAHARMDARGGDTVELHEGDEPWAALMIPHCGGDTQRDISTGRSPWTSTSAKRYSKAMRFVWAGKHAQAGQSHAMNGERDREIASYLSLIHI